MAHRIRVIDGEHAGKEGMPHERNEKTGEYSLKFDNGKVIWFKKNQLHTLKCDVLNCRTYSGSSEHDYCKKCKPNQGKEKSETPFAELLRMADNLPDMAKLGKLMEVIEDMKSGKIGMTPAILKEFIKEVRAIIKPALAPKDRDIVEKLIAHMEEILTRKK